MAYIKVSSRCFSAGTQASNVGRWNQPGSEADTSFIVKQEWYALYHNIQWVKHVVQTLLWLKQGCRVSYVSYYKFYTVSLRGSRELQTFRHMHWCIFKAITKCLCFLFLNILCLGTCYCVTLQVDLLYCQCITFFFITRLVSCIIHFNTEVEKYMEN